MLSRNGGIVNKKYAYSDEEHHSSLATGFHPSEGDASSQLRFLINDEDSDIAFGLEARYCIRALLVILQLNQSSLCYRGSSRHAGCG